jgi:MbtH protein
MTNPFDDPDGTFLVLTNAEGRYSLWPAFLEVPSGWGTAHGPDGRQSCLDVVTERWTDPVTVGTAAAREGGSTG